MISISEAKQRLPMPALLHRIGLGEFAGNSVRSPFREDHNPSWGIFSRDGKWFFKDQATGDTGDEITLLARWKGLEEKRDFPQLAKLYAELAGFPFNSDEQRHSATKSTTKETKPFSWSTCVAAFTAAEAEKLTALRGYSPDFCAWLRAENVIGLREGNWALPVHGGTGAVVACHYRVDRGGGQRPDWFYHPKGVTVPPLIFGNPAGATCAFVFESPWDAFATMDKLGWHKPKSIPGTCIVISRGATNGKLVAGMFAPEKTVYAFKQNDPVKNGKNPADEWLADVCTHAGCRVFQVSTLSPHKDINDWTIAGATAADIWAAIEEAQLVSEPIAFEQVSMGGESVENGTSGSASNGEVPSFSTLSTGGHTLDCAVFPENSWLARYMDFARLREESADSYLLGSILPVIAAGLCRRVRFPWGEGWIFPNLFSMLAGKPGDRKSSAINLAEKVARIVLEKPRFLPDSLSVEALFDEYDESRGGTPDKLLIADDANPFLGLLQKSNYGERVGQWLLRLYDCKGLAEAFRRNKDKEDSAPRRFIQETSTSIIFGATFNVCQFQGHEIRSGLQRRFNYYLAERHGRFLAVPAKSDQMRLLAVTERLAKLVSLPGTECKFSADARNLWDSFQSDNRRELAATNMNLEAQLARLNGQPTHVLKLAMIFQAALWAENASEAFTGQIEVPTLQAAIVHSKQCILSARELDAIGNRATIQADSDLLLAKIQCDFTTKIHSGAIVLTRTELTSSYAHHSDRRGTWKSDDLYLRLIPDLIRRGKAKEVLRRGKQSAFAFKVEEAL